jgi:chromosome partitioning protein
LTGALYPAYTVEAKLTINAVVKPTIKIANKLYCCYDSIMHIAVANQKGGVGKTTLAVCFAQAFAERGHHVLLIDLDPQASATAIATNDTPNLTMADVMLNQTKLDDIVIRPESWKFALAPSAIGLARREQWQRAGDEGLLRQAIRTLNDRYDYIFIDCPPTLGLLTLNGLVAADNVLAVTEASYVSSRGLGDLRETIDIVEQNYHPGLELSWVVVNRFRRTNEQTGELQALREVFGHRLLEPPIPTRTAFTEMASRSVPLNDLPSETGAREVAALIFELTSQLLHNKG